MRTLRAWLLRLSSLIRRRRDEQELSAEIEANLILHIDANLRAGMDSLEARRVALARFGGMDTAKEAWRDQKRIPFLEVLMRDTRYALRMIRNNSGFAATVILVLALGIGANVAIFSIVNAALLRPLPYKSPDRLMLLWGNVQRAAVERRGASFPDYRDWSEQNRSFEGLAAYWSSSFTLSGGENPKLVNAEVVGSNYFGLLGVSPEKGRTFLPGEETDFGAAPVAIVGHAFWRDELGSSPNVIGTSIELDSQPFTIVGVMPAGFLGLTDQAQVWVPPAILSGAEQLTRRGDRWFVAVGRLRDGVTREQAQAEMDVISRSLEAANPATNEKRGVEVASLVDETFGSVRPALVALLGAVGMVLLIACANVANLLLVRTEGRHAEIAVRTVLGASRRDLMKLLLTESFVMSFFGAALGLVLSTWIVQFILTASPIQLPSFVNVGIDRDVILFAAFLTVITAVFMGLAPALQAEPSSLSETLKSGSMRTTGAVARRRFRSALVIAEVALTFVLLAGAGLFFESFRKLSQVDPGFRTDHLLTASITAPRGATVNLQTIRESVESLPGVESVTLANSVPFTGANAIFYTAEGQSEVDATSVPRAYVHRVTPGYFGTMGIRLVSGREFQSTEPRDSVIVSEAVVHRFWPGQDGVGKRIKAGGVTSNTPWLNIVGVVHETKTRSLPNNPTADPDLYFAYPVPPNSVSLLVRTTLDPASIASTVQDELHRVNPASLVANVATMDELTAPLTARSRFTSWLTGAFSVAALILALIGIYGTMSYTVTQRSREIGIRIALGASSGDVFGIVVGRALTMIGIGLVAGVAGSVALSRGIADLLFGVSPTDLSVFAVVSALVLTTGVLAAFIPARRAVRIDPTRALREE
jgi:putative ABC transport system permease protein